MLFIFLGASGAGKTTLMEAFIEGSAKSKTPVLPMRSLTTRASRGPEDERWYKHVSPEGFDAQSQAGALVESVRYGDNAYGLEVCELLRPIFQGHHGAIALNEHGVYAVLQEMKRLGGLPFVTVVYVKTSDETRKKRLTESRTSGAELFNRRRLDDDSLTQWAEYAMPGLLVKLGGVQNLTVLNEIAGDLKKNLKLLRTYLGRHQVHVIDKTTTKDTEDWYTPAYILEALAEYFDIDVASPEGGVPWIRCERYFTAATCGLTSLWRVEHPAGMAWVRGFVWMNPPYGRILAKWMDKFLAHGHGVALVFARTSSRWFQKVMQEADVILYLPGRICFVDITGKPKADSAPAGSVLIGAGARGTAAVVRAQKTLGGVLVYPKQQQELVA